MDFAQTEKSRSLEERFDGFARHLPEDCVEYILLILDPKISPKELVSRLEAVRREAVRFTESLVKDYIWQCDPFNLIIDTANGKAHLHGVTNYGDSVEDEWLIVYILRELSNRFPELWVRVVDTDGEFLLSEAANALPRWLNPEIADNRVWIHKNTLRIIPLTSFTITSTTKTKPVSRPLTLDEAKDIIISAPSTLIQSPLIEEEAFYRLRNYPDQISAMLHHAVLLIPRKLAYILHMRPAAIAPAVEAFYLRDPIALKPLLVKSSSLTFPPHDLVAVSARFTKVLYAQVKSQRFPAPAAWQDILAEGKMQKIPGDAAEKKPTQLEMGMKVTSGFEMLISDSKKLDHRIVREIKILLNDLEVETDTHLPTDREISAWPEASREDDEKWLDINFEDFEKELQGNNKPAGPAGAFGPEPPPGFGGGKTQADLKKMVERFESFLNDKDDEPEGTESDDMDFDDEEADDDEDDESLDESDNEDKDVSFDEHEFAKMMREMMGMPSEELGEGALSERTVPAKSEESRSGEIESAEEMHEAEEIREVMRKVEAELKEEGALDLDSTLKKIACLKGKSSIAKNDQQTKEDDNSENGDDELNIDFNLAKNLLESFKSQGGLAGPGGNILGMLGIQLPRDEDDADILYPTSAE